MRHFSLFKEMYLHKKVPKISKFKVPNSYWGAMGYGLMKGLNQSYNNIDLKVGGTSLKQHEIENQINRALETNKQSIKRQKEIQEKIKKQTWLHPTQLGNYENLNLEQAISFDHFINGERHFLNGNFELAKYHLKEALRENPTNGRALYYMARISGEKGDKYINKALKYLSGEDREFQIKANCIKGIYTSLEKDSNSAMKYFNKAMELAEKYHMDILMDWDMREVYTVARFDRACIYQNRGMLDGAITDFEEVVARRQNDSMVSEALLSLMTLHYQRQNYKAAHVDYVRLKSSSPQTINNATWQIFMSDNDLKLGLVSEACDHLDDAMNLDRDSAWLYLAYCWQEDSVRATQLINAWADILANKDRIISLDELNLILSSFSERKRYDEIVQLYKKRKVFYSDYAPLLLCASDAYVEAQELEKAIDVYHMFKKNYNPIDNSFGEYYPYTIDEDVVENMNNTILLCKAVLYLRSNSFDSALVILNTLPDSILNEDILPICILLNNVYKNYDKALLQSNWYIALSHSSDAYSLRGDTYRNKSLLEEANKDYQKVVDLEADSIVTWNTALAYYYLGEKKKSQKIAKELLSSDSLSFDDYWMASLFYETIGKERKAVKYFKEALKTEHEEIYYPFVLMFYDNPSVRKKIEEIINNK